jgi:zinc-ribbon domain
MSNSRCSQCGAELLAEARFCRRCGVTVAVSDSISSSELPTALLGDVGSHATQRLDPRPTRPERGSFVSNKSVPAPAAKSRLRFPATLLLGAVILVIIVGIISSVAYLRTRSQSHASDSATLIYPGSQTVVDMTNDGGRTLQLQTSDPLEKVVAWYSASIKPTKTMRLTSTSVVLKQQNVTATIASEGGKTNILIKQIPSPK